MSIIIIKTIVNAPIEKCFDLARSIDLHVQSMRNSNEKAINGRQSGLIELNESVTWKAKHFGIYFRMTNKITVMELPNLFIDEMIKGPFLKLHHKHQFKTVGLKTEMTDIFEFKAPLGILGWLAERLFLKRYLEKLLIERNKVIKLEAEKP
ncbi:cell division protein [Pedobacter fastidiosus]|uniref:SRPBCC family protein n=1 Tax=Pedobacter fastidiosus TaxID=2765361 RepID=A0ABR7KRA8_9SPHI|nr:SRPBCC family protein [Pedobacter fastidiosus]MBC6110590.1 SRPBCC family protein [Pedobacter fastidiosus]